MKHIIPFVVLICANLLANPKTEESKLWVEKVGESISEKERSELIKKSKKGTQEPSDEDKKRYYELMQEKKKK